jgi:hypothetical protein
MKCFASKQTELWQDLTQVIFNNNYEEQGQLNARELTRLLDG